MKHYSAEVQKGLKRTRFILRRDFDPSTVEHQPAQVSWQEGLALAFACSSYLTMFTGWSFRDELEGFPFLQKAWDLIIFTFAIGLLYYLIRSSILPLFNWIKSSILPLFKKKPDQLEAWSPPSRKQILSTFDLAGDRGLFTVDVFENEQVLWRLTCHQFVKLLRTPLTLKTEADVYMDDNGWPRCVIVDSDEHKLVFIVHKLEKLPEKPQTEESKQE